jgi:hypothetical protein
VQSLELT